MFFIYRLSSQLFLHDKEISGARICLDERNGYEKKRGIDMKEMKLDKTDVLISAACGLLTGLLDVFWVGEFSLQDAQQWGRERVNNFVIEVAHTQGYTKDDLEGAIKCLEDGFINPSDKLTSDFGGGLHHHLRDFSHHPTPVGLVFSVLTQFTGEGYGTNEHGNFVHIKLPKSAYVGNTFEEKIECGVIDWIFHLASDMAGSHQNAGKGTGIPGLFLATAKEVSALPFIREATVEYKGDDISISQMISKLFNGTAFPHEGIHDVTKLDLRTELGAARHIAKQEVPLIINQCIVRSFYFIRRFISECKDKEVQCVRDIMKLESRSFMPYNNSRTLTHMLSISEGVFVAVDLTDATVRAYAKGGYSSAAIADILARVNFTGLLHFGITLKREVRFAISDFKVALHNGEDV